MDQLHKTLIIGLISVILIANLILLTINTEYSSNAITWSAVIVSVSAGIIVTSIVDKRASDAHNEVLRSQNKIAKILKQLDETDQKHNKVLTHLKQSKLRNENLAKNSITASLKYIQLMLNRLELSLNKPTLEKKEMDLIINVLSHLESPLNLIEQSVPQSGAEFKKYEADIENVVAVLRKLIIASIVVSDSKVAEVFELIRHSNRKLEILLKQVS